MITKVSSSHLTDIQLVIAGTRYNRGTTRNLSHYSVKGEPIREQTSYGR